jgi:hypothetical protein
MGRKTTALEKRETRSRALARHALTRKLERREKWLERAGVTKELLQRAVKAWDEALQATKIIERGPNAGEEVPDMAVRVKAASEIADFIRLTVGLTKNPSEVKTTEVQKTIVFTTPAWLEKLMPTPPEFPKLDEYGRPIPKAIAPPAPAEDVVDAETVDDDEGEEGEG